MEKKVMIFIGLLSVVFAFIHIINVISCAGDGCGIVSLAGSCCEECMNNPGDANDDLDVNIFDLTLIGSRFGTQPGDQRWDARADITMDGDVNIFDLLAVADNFGGCSCDVSQCAVCGNGIIETGEQCEGSDLNGETCITQGFDSGTLSCSSCLFDTSGCSLLPGDAEFGCREIIPSDTDSNINSFNEPHYICLPNLASDQRNELLIFLPGTGAIPEQYTLLSHEAAMGGLHAISLEYPNDKSVNTELCPTSPDPNCHEKVRDEIVNGVDSSSLVSVNYANSIMNRIEKVLSYLASQYPNENWGQYLTGGQVQWSKVKIAGHSQGGGHSVFIAKEHDVKESIPIAWVDIKQGTIASWVANKPSQTPVQDYYLFYHQDDVPIADYQAELIEVMGLDQYGAPAIIDITDPPYGNSHALVATIPPPPGEIEHNTVAADQAMVFDNSGNPIYKPVWRYLMTFEKLQRQADLRPSSSIGDYGVSYIDPEIYSQENLIAFADGSMQVWAGNIDPSTGEFVSPDGMDILIDTGITPLTQSNNGPEFGYDANGWSLFYSKNNNGVPQVWRANVIGGNAFTTLLSDDADSRLSVLASKNTNSPSIRLMYSLGGATIYQGYIAWSNEDDLQGTETTVDNSNPSPRWIDNTLKFTFARQTGAQAGQVAIYDTETMTADTITNDAGAKTFPYGWFAPEYGELVVLALVDDSTIGIYRDYGSAYWEKVQEIHVPEAAKYSVFGSPEPFVAGGKSYISLVVKEGTGYSKGEAWVVGLDGLELKCEDSLGDVVRSDPESYMGTGEVFVYYNVIGYFEAYKCNTGIST